MDILSLIASIRKMTELSDIDREFDSFWCLVSTDRVIGTVAVKKIDESTAELKSIISVKRIQRKKIWISVT